MLYLEDYLELIEHLPQELRDRLTYVRESDLRVNNSSLQLESRVSKFFAEAKELTPEQRQREYEEILNEYQRTSKYADDKVDITTQTHDIMIKLVDRLNGELEKFKLELEADHAGITEELERRSLKLDSDTRLDGIINNHLNHANNVVQITSNSLAHFNNNQQHHAYHNNHHLKYAASGIKDRRKSEHKHHQRHHPYYQDNGYHKRAKLSQDEFTPTSIGGSAHRVPNSNNQPYYKQHQSVQSRQSSTASSPIPFGTSISSSSAPASVAGDLNGVDTNGGHYSNNLTSFGNNPSFMKNSHKNLPINQHSALSAALSSATPPTPQQLNSVSAFAMMNATNSNQGKISTSHTSGLNDDLNSPLVRQNPIAAAASQAIAATQQLQQGRRTSSLKASFAAINAAGLGSQIDTLAGPGSNRNALAPVAPDQQAAYRYNSYGKLNANGNPLYISVTKSGRPSKRPKHPASHLYPDESPTSISSDNSVFENSESLSSAEFIETGTTFDSTSPKSLDFNNSATVEQSGTDATIYQRDDTKYCICRQISYGEMVACDNEECEIEWFHYNCVGVTQSPKGKWFCPDCTRKMDQHPAQATQKRRGRKEKSVFNLVNNSQSSLPVASLTAVSSSK